MQNYLLLEKEIEEINQISNVVDILSWDIAVNMPIGSAESRTNEISLLSSIIHSRLKSNKINDLINAALLHESLSWLKYLKIDMVLIE